MNLQQQVNELRAELENSREEIKLLRESMQALKNHISELTQALTERSRQKELDLEKERKNAARELWIQEQKWLAQQEEEKRLLEVSSW